MYKDCFKLMDINKDGQLDKNDLRGAFDNVGVLMSESELDGLLGEISGPCTYDNMVKLFQDKMAGGKFIFYSASGAPHKSRNLFVKLIDFDHRLKKSFSFLALASYKA